MCFNNEKLDEELLKTIIRKFKQRTVCSEFIDNILGARIRTMI